MSKLFNLKEKFLSFSLFEGKELNKPSKKILLTFFLLFFFKLGTSIPLSHIDNEALKKSFLQIQNTNTSIFQIINMYAGGGKTLLSPFSLGIIPFINASIVIDLCSALFPTLEKLQNDEIGRRQLMLYKKVLTIFLSILQSYFLLSTLKSYFYFNDFFNFFLAGLELVTGSLIMVWLTTIIDQKGIGNGTSLIIFTNIVTNLINKNFLTNFEIRDGIFIGVLIALICVSQMGRITIPIVSARQLAFLENNQKNKRSIQIEAQSSTLLIRFTQAGIFPIIIAANLLPIISYFFGNYQNSKILINFLYYGAIILFNYFYTTVFWDPEKISEQLRKSSVSIVNITPGRQTVKYLENVVRTSSILGGIFLCFILSFYDLLKQVFNSYFLNQISISSLIILVGVIYELQKTIRGMYKTII
jgi:preprotein translocase subunit SecY